MPLGHKIAIALLVALVTVFGVPSVALAADVDVAPIRTLDVTAPVTGNIALLGVAVDPTDRVLVTKYAAGALLVYAAGASGAATPLLTIPGIPTAAFVTWGRDNRIYVGTDVGAGSVYVYDSAGTALGIIGGANSGLACPADADVDQAGYIYVSDCGTNKVSVFAPNTVSDVAPVRTVSGGSTGINGPIGIYVLADGSFWLSNRGNLELDYWPAGASGDVAPARSIVGANTNLTFAQDVVVAPDGKLIVTNGNPTHPTVSLLVFAADATGDVAPITRVTGANTQMTGVWGVALDSARNIYVSDESGTLLVFSCSIADECSAPAPGPELASTGSSAASPLLLAGVALSAGLVLFGATRFIAIRRRVN